MAVPFNGLVSAAAGDPLPLAAEKAALRDVSALIFPVESTGTWMSVDVAPDGKSLVFDLLGDLYALDFKGGRAVALVTGMAYASQPVFSPDGGWIAFVSDAGGNENLWVVRADGSQPRQVSRLEDNSEFTSPAWAADGGSVFVSRIRPDIGAFEIREYDPQGGDGLVVAGPDPDRARDDRISRVGAAASPDGKFLYFAARSGFVRLDGEFTPWRIHRLDLDSGRESTVISLPGGAVRPVISPDGLHMLYATRAGDATHLRLRDLEHGDDRRLTAPIQADQQQRWATQGLIPRAAFTPDGRWIIYADAGGLHRVAVSDGETDTIAFRADPEIRLGPELRQEIAVTADSVRARLIQAPVPDPGGQRLAFSALGSVYVMALDGGKPERVSPPEIPAFHPAWSPDGQLLAFVSWTAAGAGDVWIVPAAGGEPKRVSGVSAYWTNPVFSRNGTDLFALRSSQVERLVKAMEYGRFREADLVRLPIDGEAAVAIASGQFAGPAQFVDSTERIYIYSAEGMESMRLDGSDRRVEFRVTGRSYYFQEQRSPVHDLRIAPDGRHALAVSWSQLYLIRVPRARGETPVIDLDRPTMAHRRVTRVGADFAVWTKDGRSFGWSVGSTYYQRPLDTVDFGEDAPRDGAGHPRTRASPVEVIVPADIPRGTLVLRGAAAITMQGDEIIENADLVIRDNRIAAIGARGQVDWPADARVLDLEGHFIIPGLVDAHAHWADVRRDVLDLQSPGFLADLAFGVTSGLDVSPLTIDMLAYQDLIEAGRMTGPRVFSTGPAVFSFNNLESRQDALDVLSRYRDHYRVANIKQYRVGNRRQRQWFAQAARELGLMPTTEGADNFKLTITQIMDGFTGVEHALPVIRLGDDVVRLLAASGASYTPTLTISDRAPGIGYFVGRDRPHEDPRLQQFIPGPVLEALTAWQPGLRDDLYAFRRHASDARRVLEAGGLVAAGSHGEFPGIGMHWEMQALAEGGLAAHQVLRIATMGSSRAIGREADLGSLAPGKLADLVVLAADPLADIANARNITRVIKNGRVFDAGSLDEIWPRQRPLPALWFHGDGQAEGN